MASRFIPRDWATMRQAIYDWARAAVQTPGVTVYWGNQNAPSPPPNPRVKLNITSPAQAVGHDEHRSSGVVIVVQAVADSTVYTATLGDTTFAYNSGVGATSETIRDGLLALIQAGPEPVSATADGDDRIRVVFEDGDLGASSSANLGLKKRLEVVGCRELTASVDVMADPGSGDATPILEELRGALENPVGYEPLQAGGWSLIDVLGTRKGDAVIGAQWQDRAGFDLRLSARSLNVREIDWIESVQYKTEGLPGGN